MLADMETTHRLNANSIPITTWALYELIQQPALWKAVQDEAETAFENDSRGERALNMQRMLGLPLLQSVYAETLRMHVAVNITREVTDETTLAGYPLPKNSLIMAPTWIAHSNEKVWGVDNHPASEFWAYRHIRFSGVEGEEEQKMEFAVPVGPSDFFPYGKLPYVALLLPE